MDSSRDAMETEDIGTKRRRRPSCLVIVLILLVLLAGGALTAYIGGTFALRQEKPTDIEATMADLAVRTLMIEPQYTDWRLPDSAKTAESVAAGKELFNVQCSLCHGQGAKGDGDFGKTMFPPAANLTADRTKSKSDGQLHWLIAHGVNYTGMPAFGQSFGGGNTQDDIWKMVAYIRSLQGVLPASGASK